MFPRRTRKKVAWEGFIYINYYSAPVHFFTQHLAIVRVCILSLRVLHDAFERAEGGNDWGRHSLGNVAAPSKPLGREIKANKQII